jgi:hypothetical protein
MAPLTLEVVGEERVRAALGKRADAVLLAAEPVIRRGALRIANRIVRTVQGGSRSGVVYSVRGGEHQASAEGEPPKSQSGFLASHVKPEAVRLSGGVLTSRVVISASYADDLEKGTVFMGPRPYVETSFLLEIGAIDDDMRRSIRGKL